MQNELSKKIREYAQKYRELGWQVIPLFSYSKNPAPLKWKDYQEKRMSDEEHDRLFSKSNITGLGVITGRLSGIVVLDEDIYKEGGKPVAVRTGMMARTARGGLHHFFRYVEPIKSSGLRKGIFVEIKADGGFLVLPPSQVLIDEKTKEYTWVDKCMPEEMMEMRETMLTPYRGDTGNGEHVDILTLVHAPLGTQHNNLRSFALSVLNRFSQKEWDVAAEVIRRQAELFDPPHPKDRVEKMIRDCKMFVISHPKDSVEHEIDTEIRHPYEVDELVEQRWKDKELEKIAPKTGWPDLDKHIAGFVPGHVITLTGDTNVGKSTMGANFAEALRRQQKKTLYIALEPDSVIIDYLASVRLRKPFSELIKEDLYVKDKYVKIFLQQDIKTPTDLVRNLRGMSEHFDLIIIDHIGYFVHGERNWIQEQSNVIKELAFLSKEFRTCVMMIAHLRKPAVQRKSQDWVPTQNDIMGSGAFKQDSQEVLIAYRPVVEDTMGTQYSEEGKLLITKTKHEGGNGIVTLHFTQGMAKIWSEKEIEGSEEGSLFMKNRQKNDFEKLMKYPVPWGNEYKKEE